MAFQQFQASGEPQPMSHHHQPPQPRATSSTDESQTHIEIIPEIKPESPSESSSVQMQLQSYQSIKDDLFVNVMREDWKAVISSYKDHKDVVQMARITRAKETALHVAIFNGMKEVVKELLEIIDPYRIGMMTNERGENPLHLAASLGQVDFCRLIIEKDVELIGKRNDEGETPLFRAALHGKKGAFHAFHPRCHVDDSLYIKHEVVHCKRNDGNTILHVAILGEYFELAFQIINWYPELIKYANEKGQTALHILAQKPSAFRSGCHLGPLDDFIYRCFIVDPIKVLDTPSDYVDESQSDISIPFPKNYQTCSDLLKIFINTMGKPQKQKQDVEAHDPKKGGKQSTKCERSHIGVIDDTQRETRDHKSSSARDHKPTSRRPYPSNYDTIVRFLQIALELFLFIFGIVLTPIHFELPLYLGFFEIHKIKKKKRKHTLTLQVMTELILRSKFWQHIDDGAKPITGEVKEPYSKAPNVTSNQDTDTKQSGQPSQDITESKIKKIISEMKGKKIQVGAEKMQRDVYTLQMLSMDTEEKDRKKRSPFLISSVMGVTEMVEEILKIFPIAINDEDEDNKNVFLLSAEYKQPAVYNVLLKNSKFASLFGTVDKDGNSALHLAAIVGKGQSWHAFGVALQMQCELKWFQFIKDHSLSHDVNLKGETPKEIFINSHKDMAEKAQKWLTDTSTACSVVVTVIATVSYASVSDLQGGKKNLDMPLRNIFAISSLVSVCSSVASLGMFLSILTSNFEMLDFLYKLPSKLILGLTLLFISVSAMLVSFSISHFFVIEDLLKMNTLPVYAIVLLPMTLFAGALFPLDFNVIRSTFTQQPQRRQETITLD